MSDTKPFLPMRQSFYVLLVGLGSLTLYMVWGYLGILFLALVLVIVFEPVYRWLWQKLHRKTPASLLATLVVVMVMMVPLGVGVSLAIGQAVEVVTTTTHQITTGQWSQSPLAITINTYIPGLVEQVENTVINQQDQLLNFAQQATKSLGSVVTKGVMPVVVNGTRAIINVVIFVMVLIYLFPVKERLFRKLAELSPLDPKQTEQFIHRFEVVVAATVKSTVFVGMTQGFLGSLMLWVLGVKTAALWGLLMGIASFVPFGAGLVWWPIGITLLLSGLYVKGIIWIAFCLLVISTMDNVIRSKVLSVGESALPELVTFLAVLGGIRVFGFLGLMIGPLIAAMFLTALQFYSEGRKQIVRE